MFMLASRLQSYRRITIIFVLLFTNLFLLISIIYLTNNGAHYLPALDDFSRNSAEKNISIFTSQIQYKIIEAKNGWNSSYISFQNIGIDFLHSHFKISLIILVGAPIVYGSICVGKLAKAAFSYTKSKLFALSMLFLGLLLFVEIVWLSTLLVVGGDWSRSFWWNVTSLFAIYELNNYAIHIQGEYYSLYLYSTFRRFFRGLGFLAIPLLGIALLGFGIYFSGTTITKEITINAKSGWTSTGLSLNSGESAEITYINGKWAVNQEISGSYLYTDINGLSTGYRVCELDRQWSPTHNSRPGQLLARIGTSDAIMPLGNQTSIESLHTGILYLRANDSDFCLRDNSGSLVVRVTIYRIDWKRAINWSIFRQITINIGK